MHIPALSYEDARLLRGARWVDLRSPAEHARDAIPGAINAPLFDDDERALVGTLYKQVSPDAAYEQGLELASARIPGILATVCGTTLSNSADTVCDTVSELAARLRAGVGSVVTESVKTLSEGGAGWVIVHCWRGGMRSRSVAALLQAMGERVALLDGGYKAYRSWVMRRLASWPAPEPNPFVLISGATGTGKTLLLQEIEAAAPGSTLDLEACAGHRSSILGAVGRSPVSQPAFESRIAARTEQLGAPPWFVEAESRKVGDAIIPDALWRAMRSGRVVELSAQKATRVQVLVEDYLAQPGAVAQIAERLPFLERRLGAEWEGRLTALHASARYGEIAGVLLEHYYDPLYLHSGRDLPAPCMELEREDPKRVERLLTLRARLAVGPAPASAAFR